MYHYNLALYFAEVASRYATRPALRYREHEYSYAELCARVEQLAQFLRSKNLSQGDVIAIANNKRPLSYALMLAAIRLGIAYVNIDSASPVARNTHILKTSGARFLFYDDAIYKNDVLPLAENISCEVIALDAEKLTAISETERAEQQALAEKIDGATIAYIMFTSGSTGIPKGVAVTHQNVLHFVAWGQQCFEISAGDNFANLSPMYFDNSVFDFYVGLFSGASLTPIYREVMTQPYELVNYLGTMQCSIWFSVPSLLIYLMTMKAMTPAALPTLRRIIFGGEGYPKPELKKLYDAFSSQATLVNVYGPTECTCICSAYDLTEKDFQNLDGLPPLGKLNQNFDYRILDDEDNDAETGELCLLGPNVAAGYFNDIERTRAAFFTLYDVKQFMKRMYRTGDLVKKIDGILYFIGRKDNQIKHMGYRIELEEIEQALAKIPSINQAAVIYQRNNSAYGKLIGFVATKAAPDEKSLLNELAVLVPDYMIPSRIIIQNELPKNANGKVDRQQLQALLSK